MPFFAPEPPSNMDETEQSLADWAKCLEDWGHVVAGTSDNTFPQNPSDLADALFGAAKAIRAEAASPAAGWQLAPIEPSEVALKAAREAYVAEMETRPVPEAFQPHNVLLAFRAAYRAVIEASPAPSEEARAG